MSESWTVDDMPSLTGRTALVTGANSGIGKQAAIALAGAGATVLLGCRDPKKAAVAMSDILDEHPDAEIEPLPIDLSDLEIVAEAAEHVLGRVRPLDLLINNAGVMAPPHMKTEQGFELQFGTNHLGHFALTGILLPKILASDAGRVVTVSSMAHRQGRMDFDDLNWEESYSRWPAYGRSKLANLLFAFELDRRLKAHGETTLSVACHPGYAATNLQTSGPGEGIFGIVLKPLGMIGNLLLAQSDEMGALPTLYAATSDDVEGGDFIGPDGIGGARGHPKKVGCSSEARDEEDARRLWDVSVEMTGVDFAPLGS
jgi:NAD(P)-dependent dehydrogenase (short-subunit alcohol dehydrogenase family)